jgi:hypothetical protein
MRDRRPNTASNFHDPELLRFIAKRNKPFRQFAERVRRQMTMRRAAKEALERPAPTPVRVPKQPRKQPPPKKKQVC